MNSLDFIKEISYKLETAETQTDYSKIVLEVDQYLLQHGNQEKRPKTEKPNHGKHKTNIAGEWRVGDLVIHRTHKNDYLYNRVWVEVLERFSSDKVGSDFRTSSRIMCYYDQYINITEMQRALGRV